MKTRILATLAVALMATQMEIPMAHSQQQAQPRAEAASSLPNGASSLNETFQDWTVVCATGDKGRICVMSQQQRKSDTNQLVLAAEFNAVSANAVKGTLVLPFGLSLADGVILQIDDQPAQKALPFATSLPVGSLVQVAFDATMLKAIRKGTVLKLTAKAYDSGQPIQLAVSLKGFSAAQDRAAALASQ